MKQHLGLSGFLVGSTIIALSAQPVFAAATVVTAVEVEQNDEGIDLILRTQAGDRPQIFTINRGNSLTADIINTRLNLPQGNGFQQDNPMPGIASIAVRSLDANSVRVIVTGSNAAPSGEVSQRRNNQLVFNFVPAAAGAASAQAAPTPVPQSIPGTTAQRPPEIPAQRSPAPVPQPSASPAPQTPPPPAQTPNVMVPNPEITIEGVPLPQPQAPIVPPFLPRAVAPPVGDIAVSNLNPSGNVVDLGTAERVPRLVLREAPAREVLALLARAAGLNLAFTAVTGQDGQAAQAGGQQQAGASAEGPRISLDIENEPVQNVFNYVLRLTGLEANRTGRTIFVGPSLPIDASNVIVRTLRMNQVSATAAANFLTAQGAETQIARENVEIQTVGEGAAARTVEIRTPEILALRAEEGSGPLLLKGLSVVTDDRLNSVTLIGAPQKIEIATSLLSQLDLRRRQVAVNVKIIDVNLLNTQDFNTSFAFGIGDSFFSVDGGVGNVSYGDFRPPGADQIEGSITRLPTVENPFSEAEPFLDPTNPSRAIRPLTESPFDPGITEFTPATEDSPAEFEYALPQFFQYPNDFLASLRAQITSGNAKILTDPTLTVQEGQTARVQLTQEVFSGFQIERDDDTNTVVREPIIRDAGLTLEINVSSIDDNGFVTLGVQPTVSSIGGSQPTDDGVITLIQERTLDSGQIRMRDGQTLILSGIIQESDRTTVSKVPILGDIPILGALFRSTNRENSRQEVIVLLTPQIIDDSDLSTFGYGYTPGRDVQEILQQRQR